MLSVAPATAESLGQAKPGIAPGIDVPAETGIAPGSAKSGIAPGMQDLDVRVASFQVAFRQQLGSSNLQ